jgi:rhamnogalacturonan endolyase
LSFAVGVALLIAFLGTVTPSRAFGAFGLGDERKTLVVDSGPSLAFKMNTENSDILSIPCKGGPELQEPKRPSQLASGFGVARFSAPRLRKLNSPTTNEFNLTKELIVDRVLRLASTCTCDGARSDVTMNEWKMRKPAEAPEQPMSRSFSIGTYRGNNAMFTYRIPASAFAVGENTLTITPLSGSGDLTPWLSAGLAYNAIQLDGEPAH